MTLYDGAATVTIKAGPYPTHDGRVCAGYVRVRAAQDVLHRPSKTTVVAFDLDTPLGSSLPVSLPPVLASDAPGLEDVPPTGLSYLVTVELILPDTSERRTLGPYEVLLPAAVPAPDLDDILPPPEADDSTGGLVRVAVFSIGPNGEPVYDPDAGTAVIVLEGGQPVLYLPEGA